MQCIIIFPLRLWVLRDQQVLCASKECCCFSKQSEIISFKLLSLHVRGVVDNRKRRKVYSWLHKQEADIMLLHKTHSTTVNEKLWANEWGRRIIYRHDTNLSRGVAILFKKNLDYVIAKKRLDCEGCFVFLDLSIQDKKYKLLNIYASNNIKNQADFFKRMKNILAFEDGCNRGEISLRNGRYFRQEGPKKGGTVQN